MRDFLVKLKPKSPFHIGEPGLGLEASLPWVPSDLLFSAICNAYASLFGKEEVEELLDSFLASPPFLITSAFPFHKDTLLLPRPQMPPKLEDRGKLKDLKKKEFIPMEVFERWVRGEVLPSEIKDVDAVRPELLPSVALDRENMTSGIYFRSALFFRKESGLFFLLRLFEEDLVDKIKGTIKFLGDMGIGGERSLGYGHFELLSFEETNLFPPPNDSSPILTLSLVVPSKEDDLDLSTSYYKLVLRGGWTTSPFYPKQMRKKRIWMLGEGSVFPKPIKGQMLDITPEGFPHRVYRYALAFPLGVIKDAERS